MSRKQPIPGVDESALAELAGQFPSGFPRPAPVPTKDDTPPQSAEVKQLRDLPPIVPEPGRPPSRTRAPGRGLAAVAMLLALLAVLIAATGIMPAPARSWFARTLGDTEIVDLVTGNRADIDKQLSATARSI